MSDNGHDPIEGWFDFLGGHDSAPQGVMSEDDNKLYVDDLVNLYIRSLGNIKVLKKKEEQILTQKIQKGNETISKILDFFPLTETIREARIAKYPEGDEDDKDSNDEHYRESFVRIESLRVLEGLVKEIKCFNGSLPKKVFDKVKKQTGLEPSALVVLWENNISKVDYVVTALKKEMIRRNLRLVINIARSYVGRGLPMSDLVQEGNLGLMKAIDRFNCKKGYKFSTSATWWIRQAITRSLIDDVKTIRVPVHVMEFYNKISRTSRELTQELGREPTNEEIAGKLKVEVKKIEEAFSAVVDPICLHAPVGDGHDDKGTEIGELVADKNSPCPYEETSGRQTSELIEKMLREMLNHQEAKIILMRFGIGYSQDYTLDQVGNHLGVTRERIRQIEVKALKKLNLPRNLKKLKVLLP